MVNAYNINKRHERNTNIYIAWHVALFNRQKVLPALNALLIDPYQTEPKEQTPEEMLAVARLINAAYGGTEVVLCQDSNFEGLDDLIRDLAEFGDKSMPGLQDVSNRAADVILHRAKAKVHVSEDEDKTHLRDLLVSRKGRTTKLKGGKKSALARVTFKKGGEHAVPWN